MKLKINSEEVKALMAAIDNLIEIKILIRNIAPNYDLDDNLNKKFLNLLKALNSELQPIFRKYLVDSYEIEKNKIAQKNEIHCILDLIKKNSLIIVSANYLKKKLKTFGVDPRNLVVTGGPLFIENYLKVNPTLSNEVLSNTKKKCEYLVSQIEKIAKTGKDLTFLYEKDNLTDQIILKELSSLEKLVNRKIKTYSINS